MTHGRRVVVIVQARMSSTRLPGKVLSPLAGTPMVGHVLRRASEIAGVDEVVAAVPNLVVDDPLAEAISEMGVGVMRGPSEDVLARYETAAAVTGADVVVRITGDCPLLCPEVGSRVLAAFVDCDYASNTLRRTYPRGLDTEVVARAALSLAHDEASGPSEREHVTPFIYRQPERFRLRNVSDDVDRSDMRWTVDTVEDMAFARAVYESLGPSFRMADVLALVGARPELAELNSGSLQRELAD